MLNIRSFVLVDGPNKNENVEDACKTSLEVSIIGKQFMGAGDIHFSFQSELSGDFFDVYTNILNIEPKEVPKKFGKLNRDEEIKISKSDKDSISVFERQIFFTTDDNGTRYKYFDLEEAYSVEKLPSSRYKIQQTQIHRHSNTKKYLTCIYSPADMHQDIKN